MLIELRTQQLADNIRKEMDLLKEEEDELRNNLKSLANVQGSVEYGSDQN